nr:uncharacterized protein LOC105465213 isoform X2 [Macaca nemestrina]
MLDSNPYSHQRLTLIQQANWMSLGMMVTPLAWMTHRLVSSNRPTRLSGYRKETFPPRIGALASPRPWKTPFVADGAPMRKLRHRAVKYRGQGPHDGSLGLASRKPLTCAHGKGFRTSLLRPLLQEPCEHQTHSHIHKEKKRQLSGLSLILTPSPENLTHFSTEDLTEVTQFSTLLDGGA